MLFFSKIPKPETFNDFSEPRAFKIWMQWAIALACVSCVLGWIVCVCFEGCGRSVADGREEEKGLTEPTAEKTLHEDSGAQTEVSRPVRPALESFPPNTNLPKGKESQTVGAIDLGRFDPARALVRFEDSRVTVARDSEGPDIAGGACLIHRSVEVPLKRLVNLLASKKGKLRVLAAYRPVTPGQRHDATSLHYEGRAVAVTCQKLSLEELAKLAWQAGFDFVLYEAPSSGQHQVHCSVKRAPAPPPLTTP